MSETIGIDVMTTTGMTVIAIIREVLVPDAKCQTFIWWMKRVAW